MPIIITVAMKGINTVPFKDIVLCDKEHKRSVKGLINIFHPRNEKELDKEVYQFLQKKTG